MTSEPLADEFISFAQKHNGIKSNDSVPFKSKPTNSANPSFIQRLYVNYRIVCLSRNSLTYFIYADIGMLFFLPPGN